MKHFLTALFILVLLAIRAQENFQMWYAVQVQVESKQWFSSLDLGYRTPAFKMDHPVQSLGRFLIGYSFKSMRIGLGYASFQHYKQAGRFSNENRPFLQLGCEWGNANFQFIVRFRQEARWIEDRTFKWRSRLQGQLRKHIGTSMYVQFGQEFLLTNTHVFPLESRSQIGIAFKCKNQLITSCFYQLNYYTFQEPNLLHVLGIGLIKQIKF